MTAITKFLAGGVVAAALMGAAPAAAQYYPGYGYPGYGQQGYSGYPGGYGYNQQALVSQCTAAVQERLSGGYGYRPYGYSGYGGGRVLGVSHIEPRLEGGLTIRGVASSGGYGYGGGYGGQGQLDLTWKCRIDYRGYITGIDINRAQPNYGYERQPYSNDYDEDYSQYGYRRY